MAMGLIVFTWYSSNLLINTFDYNFSFSPEKTFIQSLFQWNPFGGTGIASPHAIAGTLPNNLYYASLNYIGFSLHSEQNFLFYIILVSSGVSMFLLYRALGFGERYRKGAIFAATLYMFSPIASTFIWNQFASNYYSYCFMPLIAAMVVFGIRTGRGSFYILGVVLTWTLLLTASYMNPVNAFVDWMFILGLIMVLVYDSKIKGRVIKFAIILVLLWLLMNLFWIVPTISNASEEYAMANVSVVGVSNLALLQSNSVPIYNAALQTGYWALYGTYLGDHWFSWWELASSTIFIFACLIIAITAWYAFFIRPRNHIILLLGGFTALCLIMINGYYPPTGGLLVGLFEKFPVLYAFRSLYQRFGPLLTLCYSLLLGYSMANLIGSVSWPKLKLFSPRKISKKGWVVISWTVLVILSLSIVALPYIDGQVIYSGGNFIPSARVQVPDYYYQANDFLNNASGDFRVLAFPDCQIGYAAFSWENGGFWGADPSSSIFDRVFLTQEYSGENELITDIANGVVNNSLHFNLGKMLSILNVRYVMLHEDANWAYIYGNSWWAASEANFSMYESGLENAGMHLVATFGQLLLFENPYWSDIHYYQVNQIIAVIGGLQAVENLTEENWYNVSKMAFVTVNSITNIEQLPFQVDAVYIDNILITNQDWTLQKGVALSDLGNNPTMHTLIIDKGQKYLIFSENYDQGWTLISGSGTTEHFSVNLFFNGWLIENGSTSVTIEYQPQKEVTFLVLLSITLEVALYS